MLYCEITFSHPSTFGRPHIEGVQEYKSSRKLKKLDLSKKKKLHASQVLFSLQKRNRSEVMADGSWKSVEYLSLVRF